MNDLISRQAAIDVATSATMEWDGMYVQDLNVRIREAIERLPAAQPERKRGRWVINSDEVGYDVNCSKCGYGYAGRKKWNPVAEEYERPSLTLYCPYCGAEMENA